MLRQNWSNLNTYILFCGWGLRITNNRGRMWMKTLLTHGAMVWVCGDRKWIFRTTTVTQILKKNNWLVPLQMSVYMSISIYLNVSNIIVKSTNFPNKGTTREVGGIISASSRKNTVNERRILMDKLTCWRNIYVNW